MHLLTSFKYPRDLADQRAKVNSHGLKIVCACLSVHASTTSVLLFGPF